VLRVYIEYLGDSIELPRGETLVGRDVGCSLRFNDPAVSRRHMRFIHRADEAFVEDLGSANGTLLNGRAVKAPLRVHEGDQITVGSRTLIVRVITNDVEMPNTLVISASELDELEGDTVLDRVPPVSQRAPTGQHRYVPEPLTANQRCPRCAAPVSDSDPECAACKYRWGARPATPTLPPSIDRRRYDRHAMELKLIYVSEELEIEATTRDLSHSGVFVRTEILEPIGTKCQLTILIDGGPALRVNGVVRRVVGHNDRGEPVGLGVELVDIGTTERGWIDIAATRLAQ
jgi:pSer/pThr/pTyr-binding forkhead associated (FHA) protein